MFDSPLGRDLLESPGLGATGFDGLLTSLAEAKGLKKGDVAQPLRLALTCGTASPGLYDIIEILEPERIRRRIEAALAWEA
jgi:glutamyl-tRNA synthetase